MKSLASLIKIHKNRVIALNKDIKTLCASRDLIQQELDQLKEEISQEIKTHDQGAYHFMLVKYLEKAKKQQANLERRLSSFKQKVKALELALEKQFSEMKKYDIAQQMRKQKQQEIIAKEEMQFIDELNITRSTTA